MASEDEHSNGSGNREFGDLFGSEDEASDIDDGRSPSAHGSEPEDESRSSLRRRASSVDSETKEGRKSDIDNLFGSDDEQEDEEPVHRPSKRARSYSEEESPREMRQEEEEHYGEDDYEREKFEKRRVELPLDMPALPLPTSIDDKYYLAKLPSYLNVEIKPFKPEELEIETDPELTDAQRQEYIRQQVESTMRWRKRITEDGKEAMEWEDGTRSLMIGDECFDINEKPMTENEHVFLLAQQPQSGVLESHLEFTDYMTLRPSDLKSETHRHLTAQIADKHVKKIKTKMFFTEKDPEKLKQELEMQENERLRAQRKLEAQRNKTQGRYGGDFRSSRYDYGDYDAAPTYASRKQDQYEDDFVVDDDEYDEEEERSREERLAQAKRKGMDKYKSSNRYSDEEEEEEDYEDEEEEEEEPEEDEQEEEEDEERITVRRHKRRHLMSDEDED
ncbi:Leo1-like protein-domain-containing protein [Radiomyces spectabilis]|uniref:Leo1-like protein-domain-containing protein n=1 Tax=Radiomyces spectabilis TaxID=64574 RepID=UPI002220C334|nr:Leo1-like protein-domain-containing protein [Radiomyces spectabilis]KAI8388539.1 Leo1-like protein-domain-containing protein [Radiomyces spectabilis]